MNAPSSGTAAAIELLSRSIATLYRLDDGGAHEESDLTNCVTRLRKLVEALVPFASQESYLKAIDDALVVTAGERRLEEELARSPPGPWLSNRAKRLAHIAEGLRDDVNLGRLSTISGVSSKRSSHDGLIEEEQRRSQIEDEGEPPPPVKWAIWIWTNARRHPVWVLLAVLTVVAIAARPTLDWIRENKGDAQAQAPRPNEPSAENSVAHAPLPSPSPQLGSLPLVTTTVPISTREMASGACDAYSGWYELCSDNQPSDWRIVADSFQLGGDRSCTTGYAECKKTMSTPIRVCYEFRLQGHKEECGHSGNTGIQYSTGNLRVTWQHH